MTPTPCSRPSGIVCCRFSLWAFPVQPSTVGTREATPSKLDVQPGNSFHISYLAQPGNSDSLRSAGTSLLPCICVCPQIGSKIIFQVLSSLHWLFDVAGCVFGGRRGKALLDGRLTLALLDGMFSKAVFFADFVIWGAGKVYNVSMKMIKPGWTLGRPGSTLSGDFSCKSSPSALPMPASVQHEMRWGKVSIGEHGGARWLSNHLDRLAWAPSQTGPGQSLLHKAAKIISQT